MKEEKEKANNWESNIFLKDKNFIFFKVYIFLCLLNSYMCASHAS